MAAPPSPERPAQRADARRNQETLLEAAARAFVDSGVDVPVRDIAARAGVGLGTIYRHFPTRADLIVAVYRHQVEACAAAGPALLQECGSPAVALTRWLDLFVDFLVTKRGLAEALNSDDAALAPLHEFFVERLVPVCGDLLSAASAAGELRRDVGAYQLMRSIGNLCIGGEQDPRYAPRSAVEMMLAGLRDPG